MIQKKQTRIAIALALGILIFGTVGYIGLEGFAPGDALYMTVITITTVGFGEIRPLSQAGRIFTIFLILIGFTTLAWIARIAIETFVDSLMRKNLESKKMRKAISRLQNHFILCGYGRVGSSAAEQLTRAKVDFLIIESSTAVCEHLKEKGYLYIHGDATSEEVLMKAGIRKAAGLMVLLPSDAENLFVALTARELNPTLHIIARAEEPAAGSRILRAGADRIVSPHVSAGKEVALEMLLSTRKSPEMDDLPSAALIPRWIEIQDGSHMIGKNIREVANEMKREIIGHRRADRDHIYPDHNIVLKAGDKILVLDDEEKDNENAMIARKIAPRKLVVVDDNPVVLKLYTRLFKRAGYHPITAINGKEALDVILREKPDVAVIDYMLPLLSGIEVCRQIRARKGFDDVKIIIFTSDTNPETKKQAISAGANALVVKSTNTNDLIKKVLEVLEKEEDGAREAGVAGEGEQVSEIQKLFQPSSFNAGKDADQEEYTDESTKSGNGRKPELLSEDEILDRENLLQNLDYDMDFLRELLDVFRRDSRELLIQIKEAIAEKNAEKLRNNAHTLKGSLGNLGSKRAFELAQTLEMKSREGDLRDIDRLFTELERNVEILTEHLNGILKSEKPV